MRLKDVAEICGHNPNTTYALFIPDNKIEGLRELLLCYRNIVRVYREDTVRLVEFEPSNASVPAYTGELTGSRVNLLLGASIWL